MNWAIIGRSKNVQKYFDVIYGWFLNGSCRAPEMILRTSLWRQVVRCTANLSKKSLDKHVKSHRLKFKIQTTETYSFVFYGMQVIRCIVQLICQKNHIRCDNTPVKIQNKLREKFCKCRSKSMLQVGYFFAWFFQNIRCVKISSGKIQNFIS